jgi:hypothetical protein
MRLLVLLLALLPVAVAAQADQAAVGAALDRVVALARAGEDAALTPLLACYSGTGPTAVIRPCLLSHDSTRAARMAAALREGFPDDAPYVVDWMVSSEWDGVAEHQMAVKVRDAEPPTSTELRFLAHANSLLLADAGAERLVRPTLPPPASDEEAIQRTMETLFRLTGPDDGPEAAAHVACYDAETLAVYRCDYTDPYDAARVEGFRERIGAFVARVGPTGWGFTGYRTKDEREGTWHLLEIGYLDGDSVSTAYAAFIETGDGLALGDLAEWPE